MSEAAGRLVELEFRGVHGNTDSTGGVPRRSLSSWLQGKGHSLRTRAVRDPEEKNTVKLNLFSSIKKEIIEHLQPRTSVYMNNIHTIKYNETPTNDTCA